MLLKWRRFRKHIVVIMAGGQGKRLWPLSTESDPKQLNAFFSKKTMLAETYDRAHKIFPKSHIVVVTTEILAEETRKLLPIDSKNIFVQPANMDTNAAMGMTALLLNVLFPECTAVFLYADHFIPNNQAFVQTIKRAMQLAAKHDEPIAVGTAPKYADTQLGYIEVGASAQANQPLHWAKSFYEKPDKKTAERFVKSGRYVWNTGVKVWHAASLLKAIKETEPKVYQELVMLRAEYGGRHYHGKLMNWFSSVIPESFESAVSEKLDKLLVYVADYEWRDIGNWSTFYDIAVKDKERNVILPNGSSIKVASSHGCLVAPHQKNVVVFGVSDIVIVQSEDTLLVCDRKIAANLKDVIS